MEFGRRGSIVPRKLKPLAKLSPAYRKRIESYMRRHPFATRKEARGHKPKKRFPLEDMVRNTWGSYFACESKGIESGSFTFMVFSKDNLSSVDRGLCRNKFIKLLEDYMRRLYPNAHYSYDADYWGSEIEIRNEINESVVFDKDFFGKWVFSFKGDEVNRGELDEIL